MTSSSSDFPLGSASLAQLYSGSNPTCPLDPSPLKPAATHLNPSSPGAPSSMGDHNPLGGVGVRSVCLVVAGELQPAVPTAVDQRRKGRKSFASDWSRASSASTQPVPNVMGRRWNRPSKAPIEPCIKRPLDGSKSDASASLGEGTEPTLTSSGNKGRRTKYARATVTSATGLHYYAGDSPKPVKRRRATPLIEEM